MREVIYRGFSSISKQWIYGNLVQDRFGKKYVIPFDYFELDGHHLTVNSDIPVFIEEDTISMCLNIRDSKRTDKYPDGQMIFEGDIFLYVNEVDGDDDDNELYVDLNGEKYIVFYNIINSKLCSMSLDNYKQYLNSSDDDRTYILSSYSYMTSILDQTLVIGNIYENIF